jgi:hypothetical protein
MALLVVLLLSEATWICQVFGTNLRIHARVSCITNQVPEVQRLEDQAILIVASRGYVAVRSR